MYKNLLEGCAARRQAYESLAIRKVRARLHALHVVETLTRPPLTSGVGCWPRNLVLLCDQLRRQQVHLPQSSLAALRAAVVQELKVARGELDELNRHMR